MHMSLAPRGIRTLQNNGGSNLQVEYRFQENRTPPRAEICSYGEMRAVRRIPSASCGSLSRGLKATQHITSPSSRFFPFKQALNKLMRRLGITSNLGQVFNFE